MIFVKNKLEKGVKSLKRYECGDKNKFDDKGMFQIGVCRIQASAISFLYRCHPICSRANICEWFKYILCQFEVWLLLLFSE